MTQYNDDTSITPNSPINRYIVIPVPDSAMAKQNAYGTALQLADLWRYGKNGDNSKLGNWHNDNVPFYAMAVGYDLYGEANMKVAMAFDQKSDGTSGGNFTSGLWLERELNSLLNPDGFVSLISNGIHIQESGKYVIKCSCPAAIGVAYHQCRLLLNGGQLAMGTSEYASSSGVQTRSQAFYVGYLTVGDIIKIEHRCSTTTTNGLGVGLSSLGGTVEIYSIMEIVLYN